MPTRNVNMTNHLDRFVEASVASGRYQNASEVVREGLRLLEQRDQEDALRLRHLRAAVQASEGEVAKAELHDLTVAEIDCYFANLGVLAAGQEPTPER